MNIMNLIYNICLIKNKINNTPKWKYITKRKLEKHLNENISMFLNLDIYIASENILTFLLGLGEGITQYINDYVCYNYSYMAININNDTIINVHYYPKSNRFDIYNENFAYSIYKNNKICNKINKLWTPLTTDIKKRYLDMIIEVADYLK